MIKQNVYLFLENSDQLSYLEISIGFLIVTFDWYLFQSIVLLKLIFKCYNSFALSLVDKDTTETQSFVSVSVNFSSPVKFVMTQCDNQVRMRLISKLVKAISRVFQKLLKFFNDNAISTSFVSLLSGVFPVFLILDLNDSKFVIAVSWASSP